MNSFFYGVALTVIFIMSLFLVTQFIDLWKKSKLRMIKNRRLVRLMDRDAENQRKAELLMSDYIEITPIRKLGITDSIGMNSTIL